MKFDLKSKILSVVLVTVFMIIITFYCIGFIITHGPSPAAKQKFVISMSDSALTEIIPKLYLSSAEIEEILTGSDNAENINISSENITVTNNNDTVLYPEDTNIETEYAGIEIINIDHSTYSGKLMIISDPSRITLGTPEGGYGFGRSGETVYNMMKSIDAVAGINAGGLTSRTGGIPEGVVIKDGEVLWGNYSSSYYIAGFDSYNSLHVGKMTLEEALNLGVKNATSFGPALIIDGTAQLVAKSTPDMRTAIGQRADGAVLLLAINSDGEAKPGATHDDLIEIFTEYNAINATNLYCGSAATLILGEENISGSSFATDYPVATAILVK